MFNTEKVTIEQYNEKNFEQANILLQKLFFYKNLKPRKVKKALKKRIVIVAKYDDLMIGIITFQSLLGFIYIRELIVDEKYRKRGIGENLLKKTLSEASKKGWLAFLTCKSGRTAAHKFYYKHKFKKLTLFTNIFYRTIR